MYKNILLALFCLATIPGFAIDYYEPGDTLWVWAQNGLNIREKPDAYSKILGTVANADPVISLGYLNMEFPYSVEVTKKSTRETSDTPKENLPNFELTGYWAKVTYNGIVGYVFDAYLSKLQTFFGHQNDVSGHDDFHVFSLKKQAKVLKQIGLNEYGKDDKKFVRYIFDNGNMISLSGGSGHWEKEMLFSNGLSLTEGYLIYHHTMKSETDILLEKGEDFLKFEVESGFLTIKKIGSFLVIYEEHNC